MTDDVETLRLVDLAGDVLTVGLECGNNVNVGVVLH